MPDSEKFARDTATAAAKVVYGYGILPKSPNFLEKLFEEATLHDCWNLHVSHDRMQEILVAEYNKHRGRVIGGHVAAARRRYKTKG
jgi:oligoribonuclease NrnB/cAMP/cGMP phosphodiesterase (DHH superfamily)